VAEGFIIYAKVVDVNTRFRHACAAAGFERVDWPIRKTLWHPATNRTTAQPLILKKTKTRKVVVGLNLLTRIPIKILREIQPEGTTSFRIEVPCNNFTYP